MLSYLLSILKNKPTSSFCLREQDTSNQSRTENLSSFFKFMKTITTYSITSYPHPRVEIDTQSNRSFLQKIFTTQKVCVLDYWNLSGNIQKPHHQKARKYRNSNKLTKKTKTFQPKVLSDKKYFVFVLVWRKFSKEVVFSGWFRFKILFLSNIKYIWKRIRFHSI